MKPSIVAGILAVVLVVVAASINPVVHALTKIDPVVETAIREQLPESLPPETEIGWPQHAFTMAITWYRVGETERAHEMADELWQLRDPATGLWRNSAGDVDVTNPFFATVLYELLGQHERARDVSRNAIRHARATWNGGAYNGILLTALTGPVVGQPPPSDLMTIAYDGLFGSYSTHEHGTARGRYYADIMRTYWCVTGGECWGNISDETDYCPTLVRGREECEAFYRWSRGEPAVPDLDGQEYSFWTDGILFYALPGLDLEFGSFEKPFRSLVPNVASGR